MFTYDSHETITRHETRHNMGETCEDRETWGVVGGPSGVMFREGDDVTIVSWGTFPFTSMKEMFSGCGKVTIEDTNSPVFAPGCDLSFMFSECQIIGDISHWNTTNVTNMEGMFCGNMWFDQSLNWNTSNVTNMSLMFSGCENLNQPINLITSKVTTMAWMFNECCSFNQPVNFDTSNVINMFRMFSCCIAFDQHLSFNTSNVTIMDSMFYQCFTFNQLLLWDISKVVDMGSMFQGCKNFKQTLPWDLSHVSRKEDMFSDRVTLISAEEWTEMFSLKKT